MTRAGYWWGPCESAHVSCFCLGRFCFVGCSLCRLCLLIISAFFIGGARTLFPACSLHPVNSIFLSYKISISHLYQPAVLFSFKKLATASRTQFLLGDSVLPTPHWWCALPCCSGPHLPIGIPRLRRRADAYLLLSFFSRFSCSYLFLHSSLVTSEIC